MDSVFGDKQKEMDGCMKEVKKGITCEYSERGDVKSTTSTKNKGASQYPTDGEARRLEEPGMA